MTNVLKKIHSAVKIGLNLKDLKSTENTKKNLAAQKVAKLLSENSGFLLKMGQYLGTAPEAHLELQKLASAEGSPQLDFAVITQILVNQYQRPLNTLFSFIEPLGHAASISQVHKATTCQGQIVALKIKLPEIEEELKSWMTILGLIPRVGPLKQWQFQLNTFSEKISQTLAAELDFDLEYKKLARIFALTENIPWLKSPQPIKSLCTKDILAMTWTSGEDWASIQKLGSVDRQKFATLLTRFFLKSIFQWNYYQSDPNPGNFLYQNQLQNNSQSEALVLLDAASFCEISSQQSQVLATLVYQNNLTAREIIQLFTELGFDPEKLLKIEPQLPELIQIITEPFRSNEYQIKNWNPKDRIDQLLHENKWWFRSAGSASFFPFMRALGLFARSLASLNVPINFFEMVTAEVKMTKHPPPLLTNVSPSTSIVKPSKRFLEIRVRNTANEDLVEMQMAIHEETRLEDLIPADILLKLKSENIEISKLNQQIQTCKETPYILFTLDSELRRVRVRVV